MCPLHWESVNSDTHLFKGVNLVLFLNFWGFPAVCLGMETAVEQRSSSGRWELTEQSAEKSRCF